MNKNADLLCTYCVGLMLRATSLDLPFQSPSSWMRDGFLQKTMSTEYIPNSSTHSLQKFILGKHYGLNIQQQREEKALYLYI